MTTYDYTDQLAAIAAEYDGMSGELTRDVRAAWTELADHSERAAAELARIWTISETDEAEPYADAPAMFADLARGRFTVSRANSEHPLWTVEQNVAFRIVHDIAGHYAAHTCGFSAGFDWEGENHACAEHFADLACEGLTLAMSALFTECIAQTGSAIFNGQFGAQKVGILRAFDA